MSYDKHRKPNRFPFRLVAVPVHGNQHCFHEKTNHETGERMVMMRHTFEPSDDPEKELDLHLHSRLHGSRPGEKQVAFHLMVTGPGTTKWKPTFYRVVVSHTDPFVFTDKVVPSIGFSLIGKIWNEDEQREEAPIMGSFRLDFDSATDQRIALANAFGNRFLPLLSDGTFNLPFLVTHVVQNHQAFARWQWCFQKAFEKLWRRECIEAGILEESEDERQNREDREQEDQCGTNLGNVLDDLTDEVAPEPPKARKPIKRRKCQVRAEMPEEVSSQLDD